MKHSRGRGTRRRSRPRVGGVLVRSVVFLGLVAACVAAWRWAAEPSLSIEFCQGGPTVLDIFRSEARGRLLWVGTAKNFEEAKSKAKQSYLDNPTEYYLFDYATQTKHQISEEELKKGST